MKRRKKNRGIIKREVLPVRKVGRIPLRVIGCAVKEVLKNKKKKDMCFVVFSVKDGDLLLSRWSGTEEFLIENIGCRFGTPTLERSHYFKNLISKAKIGEIVSFASNHDFAFVREG